MAQRRNTSGRAQRRRGMRFGVLGGVIVGVLIIIVAASGSSSSTSLPPGAWGKTIACLEGHPLFAVFDANSNSAAKPGKHTTAVAVNSQLHGYGLATIEHTASSAAARAVKRNNGLSAPTANYNVAGSMVWAYNEGGDSPHVLVSASDQAAISNCIR